MLMKPRYHLFRRENGVYYSLDVETNLEIARVYLHHSVPAYSSRTWQQVMDEMARHKRGETQKRWERAVKGKSFDLIRNQVLIRTKSQDFLDVLATGAVCPNIFLRRLHNFALGMDWLPKAVIPRRQWPKIEFKSKRAITFE